MTHKKDSILWCLSRKDSHFASYIMGTMHIQDATAFSRVEEAKALIDKCYLYAGEFNLDDSSYQNHAQDILIPNEVRLSELIRPSKFQKISKTFFKTFNVDLSQFDRMLPMLTISAMSQKVLSSDHSVSLDQYLWDYASREGKELTGIESYQKQLQVMKQIDLDYQVQSLLNALRNTKKFKRKLEGLVKDFKNEKIHKLYKDSKKSLGRYRSLLLYQRNIDMSYRIEQLSLTQHCFIAIGAGHLSGKKGVLHLLKEKGFILKPC